MASDKLTKAEKLEQTLRGKGRSKGSCDVTVSQMEVLIRHPLLQGRVSEKVNRGSHVYVCKVPEADLFRRRLLDLDDLDCKFNKSILERASFDVVVKNGTVYSPYVWQLLDLIQLARELGTGKN